MSAIMLTNYLLTPKDLEVIKIKEKIHINKRIENLLNNKCYLCNRAGFEHYKYMSSRNSVCFCTICNECFTRPLAWTKEPSYAIKKLNEQEIFMLRVLCQF